MNILPSNGELSKLPLHHVDRAAGITLTETQVFSSGPLPNPETLGLYDRVSPGLAKLLVESFQSEYLHRHRTELMALEADIEAMRRANALSSRGQLLAFVIAVAGLGCGTVIALYGQPLAGAVVAGFGLGSVLSAFLRSRLQKTEKS